MNLHPGSTFSVERSGPHSSSEIRLRGAWLILARVTWLAIALLALGLITASLPSYFAYLHVINTTSFDFLLLVFPLSIGFAVAAQDRPGAQNKGQHIMTGVNVLAAIS
jgi:hypothetical protein